MLYQEGGSFEAYGGDAQTVSEALALPLTSRFVGDNQSIPVCSLPENRLDTYLNMLLDRGFDVAVSAAENGKRNTRKIVSSNKEDPVRRSRSAGLIICTRTEQCGKALNTQARISSQLIFGKKRITECLSRCFLIKDKEGNTISRDFAEHLDPPPQGIEIIDSPYLANDRADEMLRQAEQIAAENARRLMRDFSVLETDEGYAIWDDLTEAIYIDDEGVSEEI